MMHVSAAKLILGVAVLVVMAVALPVALAQFSASNGRAPAAVGAATTPPSAVDASAKGRYMDFQVVDSATGQGIADVDLTIRTAAEMPPQSLQTFTARTDANGRYRIQFPPKNPAVLQVEARKAALVPMGITWSAQELQGGMLPAYTLKMEKGTTIGGNVRDEQGQPIAGASVKLLVEGSGEGSDHPRALIRNYEVKTDAQGKWRCDVMPSKPEGVSVKVSHPAFQSDASYGASGQPNNDDLRKMTSVLVMKKGMDGTGIAGVVNDGQTGKPIAGVKVRQGDDYQGTKYPETTTDASGGFRFASVKAGKLILTAQVAGYMPELQEIEVKPGMEPVRFQLRRGQGFAGVVVDVDGKPVAGARVDADTWRGKRTIRWQGTTDADGQFFWDDAPADEVEYSIFKQGYVYNRRAKGTSGDEPTRFTLLPEMKIHGKVVDAETGKPIEKFRVVVGLLWKEPTRWFWNDRGSRTLTDGWYEATMNQPAEEYALRIEADGYLSVVTESVKPGTADVVRDVKLRRGSDPQGVVLGVGGRPVEGAKLFLIEEGQQSCIVAGRTTDWMMERIRNRTTSHGDGRFALQPAKKAAVVIAFDEQGIAVVPLDASSPSDMTVKLSAWATIEGTLREGKKVLPGIEVYAMVRDRADERVDITSKAVTDAQGKFTLKYVPPMKVQAGKLGESGFYIPMANVEPKPGEILRMDLGGTGVTITGKVEMPAGVEGSASVGGSPSTAKVEYPEDWDLMAPDQRQAWRTANARAFNVGDFHQARIGADGTFELVDMPDGNFELRAYVSDAKRRIVAGAETVLVSVKNSSGDTLDVGLIKLKAWPLVDIGMPCPDLSVKAMDGAEVRLSDLRGKWVLVTGWISWTMTDGSNQRRPEDIVNAALAAGGGKLEAVTIFTDDRKVWVDRYLAKHPVSGKLVHAAAGKENWSDEVNAYYGAQGVLIGPDGIVRAKGFLAQGKDPVREISAAMR